MPTRLNPYVSFDGNAREAMEFYRDVFGGSLEINTFGEYGGDDPSMADKTMHAMLETDRGFTLMASDAPPGMQVTRGDNIAISLSGEDADELRGYWQKLSDGGSVTMPLEKQMWGDEFGVCVDRFGVPWMVDIVQTRPSRSTRADTHSDRPRPRERSPCRSLRGFGRLSGTRSVGMTIVSAQLTLGLAPRDDARTEPRREFGREVSPGAPRSEIAVRPHLAPARSPIGRRRRVRDAEMQVGHAEPGVAGLPSEAQQLTRANPITGSETCGDGSKMRAVVPDPVITDQAHESTTASPRLVEVRLPAIDPAHRFDDPRSDGQEPGSSRYEDVGRRIVVVGRSIRGCIAVRDRERVLRSPRVRQRTRRSGTVRKPNTHEDEDQRKSHPVHGGTIRPTRIDRRVDAPKDA